MRSITVSCSPEGFNEAAEWLEAYKQEMLDNTKKVLASMLKAGEQMMINNLGHIDTGETLESIVAYRNGNKGVLTVGGNAIWIEFGTGTIYNGEGYNHPKAQELGMSAHGTYVWHGNLSGLPHGADPNGWWYYGDDGEVHHTNGIPGNRFVYNTAQYLRREYPKLAKEVFA